MQTRLLLFLLLPLLGIYSANAQSCEPLSDNINLGGAGHDAGFQSLDPVHATASLSNGNFVVAWESRDGIDGDDGGCFFQVFQPDGTAVTAVINPYADVNPMGTGKQGVFGPKVFALNSGFVLTWVSEDGPGDMGPSTNPGEEVKDIFYRVYDDNGSPTTGSTRIDNGGKEDNLEFVLPLSNGGFAILHSIGEDAPGNNTDDHFIQTFNAQGAQVTSGPVNISGGAHDGHFQNIFRGQAMAELSDGKFAVTWEARDGVDGAGNGGFFRIFNADGTPVTAVTAPYLDVNPMGTRDQATFGSRVIGLTNGNMVMAWDDGAVVLSEDVYFRVYDSNGMAVSATTQVDGDLTDEEAVLSGMVPLTNGNFAILYHTDERSTGNTDDFYVRVYNSSGVAVSGSVEISGGLHTGNFSTTQQFKPGIVALSNGNFAVGWAARDGADGDQSGAFYRVFNSSGAAVSDVATPYSDVNMAGTGDQSPFGPIIKPLAQSFVIAWQSEGGPGDVARDVYHRVINNDGTPFCPTTKTNSGNDGIEENIEEIQPLNNGNFALVYKDEDADNKDDLFVRVTGAVPATICPTIGSLALEPTQLCRRDSLTFIASGLENMAQANNGEQNYGIRFVVFSNAVSDPYNFNLTNNIGEVSFEDLSEGGTEAVFKTSTNFVGERWAYAILSTTPADVACRPFVEFMFTSAEIPVVSFTAPADIFENAGVQSGLGGGTPVGGVYSGPGVTDDGNGMTYSFDPVAAGGVGTYTITYTFTSGEGCEGSASDDIEVLEKVLEVVPIDDINDVDPTTGVALSDGEEVALQGVVHCIDFLDGDGYNFWILEPNGDGMLVYSDTTVMGYEATEGDEIRVEGFLAQFDGQLEINPASITLISQDNDLVVPIGVTELNESLESKLVTLEITDVDSEGIELIDLGDGDYFLGFPTSQDTFTIIITAASGIDIDFLNNYLALNDVTSYSVTGFVLQTDFEAPFDDDYSIVACSEGSFNFVSDVNEPAWANELLIYPNPATYQVNINAPVNIERLRLMNAQGRVLQNTVIDNATHTLDLSALPKGVYQVQLIGEGGMVNRQVVRQ
jgi:hypothetical protein